MHAIIDDAFPPALIAAANAEWPAGEWPHWHVYEGAARKRATKDESRVTPACRLLLNEMAKLSHSILPAGAFPDLTLHGAGMHELPTDGFLGRHLDGDSHPSMPWRRVASGVLILGDDFTGGEFCLEEAGDVVRVPQRANRLVLFLSHDDAWHWVEPVTEGSRRTLAIFWWRVAAGGTARDRAQFREA